MICEHCGRQNPNNAKICKNCGALMPALEAGNSFRDILNFKDDATMDSPRTGADVETLHKRIRKLKTALCIISLVAAIAIITAAVLAFKPNPPESPELTPPPIIATETPTPTETPEISPSPSPLPTQPVTVIPQTPTIAPTDDAALFGYHSEETEKPTFEPQETMTPMPWGSTFSSITDNQQAEESTNPIVENSPSVVSENEESDEDADDETENSIQTSEPIWERGSRGSSQLP